MDDTEVQSRLIWDEAMAQKLPGKLVLVGINNIDTDGNLVGQQQMFGRVIDLVRHSGIRLQLEGQRAGEHYTLPPDMRSMIAAGAGDYHLRSTGEVVADPDYTVTFAVHRAPEGSVDAAAPAGPNAA